MTSDNNRPDELCDLENVNIPKELTPDEKKKEYLRQTGDREAALEMLPTALKQLELSEDKFDSDLVRDSDQLGWCFVDWNLNLNKQASAQAIWLYCAQAAIELCKRLVRTVFEKTQGAASCINGINRKAHSARHIVGADPVKKTRPDLEPVNYVYGFPSLYCRCLLVVHNDGSSL